MKSGGARLARLSALLPVTFGLLTGGADLALRALAPTTPVVEAALVVPPPSEAVRRIEAEFRSEMPDAAPERTRALAEAVVEASARVSLDPLLILAVIRVESGFESEARSPRGAFGLMQLRPDTLAWLAERRGMTEPPELLAQDPVASLELAIDYLGELRDRFGGDLDRALMAYNAGPRRLREALRAGNSARYAGYPRAVRRHWRAFRRPTSGSLDAPSAPAAAQEEFAASE